MGVFKKLKQSVRARIAASLSKEISGLRKEQVFVRQELEALRQARNSSEAGMLDERLQKLEILFTEHPRNASRGMIQPSFPSPAVSIVLPTWNRAKFLADAIASAQEQSFKDWELLVIDDGSSDETSEIVANFSSDARIRYVQQAHAGVSAARNHGLRLAKGALIAYLDSDNLWYPDFLTFVVTAFANDSDVDCAYGALVSEAHGENKRILFETFDRPALLKQNFIDLNTFVHRRKLVDEFGSFDESLDKVVDWDLILRYTQHKPARPLPVLAARYRMLDEHRITENAVYGPNLFRVRRKWFAKPELARPIRVLYLLWHYPQLSETYVENEISTMKRWGAHIEVWSEEGVASPYEPSVPVHRGTLEEAIAKCQPDIIHIHWVQFALNQKQKLEATGLPITVRAHGFEVTDDAIRALLGLAGLKRAYFFPHQIKSFPNESRLVAMNSTFDTTLFQPEFKKDRNLVLRTGAGLPSKDYGLYFDLAKLLPTHRFVLAVVTAYKKEDYIGKLQEMAKAKNSPVEIRLNVSRKEMASLFKAAGYYAHTVTPPDQGGTPLGMPVSIAEALATGAHVLTRDIAPFNSYYGPVSSIYRDAEHAAKLIRESDSWQENQWKQSWANSIDHAYRHHADETVLRPLFDDWCAIMQSCAPKS